MTGTQQPLSSFLWALAGPIVWFVHFVGLYLAEAFLCIAPGADTTTNLRVAGTGLTLLALTLLFVRLVRGAYADRDRRHATAAGAQLPFAQPLTLLSILAVVWTSVPMFLLPACVPGSG